VADEFDTPALERWLCGALGADRVQVVGDVRRPQGSGFSAETLIFPASVLRDGATRDERLVLRLETPDPAVYPQQADVTVEVEIQYRVMDALARHSRVPIAPLIAYEHDRSVLGAPFFVMRYVDGVVPVENPVFTREGFFVEATPEQRHRMVDGGLGVLAAVHDVDWRAAGFEWLVPEGTTPGSAAQLSLWQRYAERELDGRRHPAFEEAVAWLWDTRPPHDELVLCWGDARLGNIIWHDFTPVCATDFEAASIGPPALDLGWWLMFDRWVHETMGVSRLPGDPDRDWQRQRYGELTGRDVGDTLWYEVFAAARYAAIVVRVMNRTVLRGQLPHDQVFWLENPATDCLRQLLACR
jgi:aminoglycoside phosphotransferase (APT) family kinase protein